ncbi:MAG: hypothetical protein M0002_03130 [Rhodospirillales bacterium]|nr:hypothetical protein [Rhodospirillales bacterium]
MRVPSADPNPAGPGMRFEDLSPRFDERIAGRQQQIHQGSYGIVGRGPSGDNAARTWTVLVAPGIEGEPRAVLAGESEAANALILIGGNGASARLAWPGGTVALGNRVPMCRGRWYRVWLTADARTGRVLVGRQALDGGSPPGGEIFSVGSITFCGSLWRNGFEAPVSRLLENVVRWWSGGSR